MRTIYRLVTKVGVWEIRPDGERARLYLGDIYVGNFHRASAAAEDVYFHHTGYSAWDASPEEAPIDLEGWELIRLPD